MWFSCCLTSRKLDRENSLMHVLKVHKTYKRFKLVTFSCAQTSRHAGITKTVKIFRLMFLLCKYTSVYVHQIKKLRRNKSERQKGNSFQLSYYGLFSFSIFFYQHLRINVSRISLDMHTSTFSLLLSCCYLYTTFFSSLPRIKYGEAG